jgi:uncharacterized membrane protein HdeD (DUF308 family)
MMMEPAGLVTTLARNWWAIAMRRVIDNEVRLGLAGLASVGFGLIVLIFPGAGAVGIAWLIASYAIVFGVILLMLGFRLRRYVAPSPTAT